MIPRPQPWVWGCLAAAPIALQAIQSAQAGEALWTAFWAYWTLAALLVVAWLAAPRQK